MQIGRRIIFDKVTGMIWANIGEMNGDFLPRKTINGLDYIDLEYGQFANSFAKAESYHVDPITKTLIFDKLNETVLTPQEQIEDLQNQLMIAQGVI